MAKISIIVPIYNVEKYLKECIDSIINQSFKDIEIILINDGSTDNSLNIMQKYAKTDSRIIIINQKNMGQGNARNKGIKIAKAPYLAFVDSDDFIDSFMFEKLYKIAVTKKSDIIKCKYYRVLDVDNLILNESKNMEYKEKEDFFKNILSIKQLSLMWEGLYKKSLFIENNLYFKEITYEDTEILFKLFFYAKTINYTNEAFYYWRKTINSTSGSINISQIDNIFLVFKYTHKFLKDHNIYIKYKLEFLQRCFHYHNRFIDKIKTYSNKSTIHINLKYLNKKIYKSKFFSEKNLLFIKKYDKSLYLEYLEKTSYLESYLHTKNEELIYQLKINTIRQLFKIEELLIEKENLQVSKSKNIKCLHNKFKNKSCIVVGKGPSYQQFNKEKLKNKFTFIFSDLFMSLTKDNFKPTFYIEEDQIILNKYLNNIKSKAPAKYNFLPLKYEKELKNEKFYFFNQDFSYHKFSDEYFEVNRFSKNLEDNFYSTSSSMYLCLQLAYYLGFSKVYLLGIDLNYEKEILTLNRDTTKKGISKIVKDFKYVKNIFEKDNREIFNLSKESILKMFKYSETIN